MGVYYTCMLFMYVLYILYIHCAAFLMCGCENCASNQIADFGVSEEIERTESNLSRYAGTPAFVAPECLDGE